MQDLIQLKNILHEGFALQKAHHHHVGMDQQSFEEMKKHFVQKQKKTEQDIARAQEKLKNCTRSGEAKMSDELRRELTKYFDRTMPNCTKRNETSSSLKHKSPDQRCHMTSPDRDFGCGVHHREDKNPKDRG